MRGRVGEERAVASGGDQLAVRSQRRHLGGGALAATASQLVILVAGALTSIAIARILGPDGTGSFALAANFFAVALLVSGIGIKQGIVVLVGSGRWAVSTAVRDLALPLAVMGLAGCALALAAFALARHGALEGLPSAAVPMLAAAIPFGLAWQWSWSLALAGDRYEPYALLYALPTLLALAMGVTLAITSGTVGAVIGFAAAQIAAGAASGGWAVRYARSREHVGKRASHDLTPGVAGAEPRLSPRGRRLRAAYRFGLLTWAAELLQFVNFRFDLFFLAAFVATAEVGVYAVAATVTGIALVLPQSLAAATLSRSAALEGASHRGEASAAEASASDARASRHTVLLLPLAGMLVAGLLLGGVPLLYGPAFDEAIELGFILLPGTLALGLTKIHGAVVLGRGKPQYPFYTVAVTVPLTVTAYLLVIPQAGATGAAVVSSASYLVTATLTFAFFKRVSGIPISSSLIPRPDDLRAYPELAVLLADYVRLTVARLVRR